MRKLLPFLIICFSTTAVAQIPSAEKFWEDLKKCKQDSDCKSATEVWHACHHVCGEFKYEKCEKITRVCPAYGTGKVNFPDCAASMPCIPPKKIWCENGQCKSA